MLKANNPAPDQTAARIRAGMRAAVGAELTANRIVGAVVAIAHRGETIMLEAFGHADREAARAMSTDAIFLLASATKPIATAAILSLSEDGMVDLDAPITEYLPDFRPALDGGERPAISMRQLLSHTSGLGYPFREPLDGPYHRAGVSSGSDQPGLGAEEQLRRLASVPLLFRPGTSWNYSLGVDVAGLAAQAAAGRSLQTIVADRITGPLGMNGTAFAVRDPARLVAHYGVTADGRPLRMTDGYLGPTAGVPARWDPSRLFDPKSYPSGGAGMAGTASDLLAFIEMLRTGGETVLSHESIRAMRTSALPKGMAALEPGWSYGLGTEVLVDPATAAGPENSGAFKGSGGYGHRWFVDPELGLSVATLTNSAPEGLRGRFATATRDAAYAAFA